MSFESTFLSSVIADPVGATINDDITSRRYSSIVTGSTKFGGVEESRMMRILYEIKRKTAHVEDLFADKPETVLRGDAAYPTNGVLRDDFTGLARKYSNFSGNFAYSSLGGLVERIATGIAALSVYGSLSSEILTNGRDISIYALGTFDSPVNSMTNTLFIPRLVNSMLTNNVFAVLIAAAAGCGARIATDILEIDLATRRPVVPTISDGDFGMAAVEALRILGANMILSDQGPLFALAVTRGIHAAVSVVSHTDEGGVNRDLLRCGSFGTPFGGIHHAELNYLGIPAFAMSGNRELAAWVDSIALTTAAAVAHADPGITYDGRWYPTLIDGTLAATATVDPGIGQAPEEGNVARNRRQLLDDYPRFLENYLNMLGYIFGAQGDTQIAVKFQNAAASDLGMHNAHLRYQSITPYFWVEPTSLISPHTVGTPAELNSLCNFGGKHETRIIPAFEDIMVAGPSNGMSGGYIVEMRNARSSGLINYLNMHPKNGLAGIQVRQADPMSIIQPGGVTEAISDRIRRNANLSEYLWTRGQSPFCAPGELMSIKPTYGLYVQHATMDNEGFFEPVHVPSSWEFADCTVTFRVGVPTGLTAGRPNNPGARALRARTKATRELAAVTARVRLYKQASILSMPQAFTAPMLIKRPEKRLHETVEGEGDDSRGGVRSGNSAPERNEEPGRAATVTVTAQNGPVTFPQVVRSGNAETGRAVAQAVHDRIIAQESGALNDRNITEGTGRTQSNGDQNDPRVR